MTPRIAALALAAATLALAAPAHAGGGVRLNFGGPLPSFVATPTPGYGGSRASCARKSAPKIHTARRAPAEAAPQRKVRMAKAVEPAIHHKAKVARAVVPVRHVASVESKATAVPVTAGSAENPGLLGRALAVDSLPRAETVRALLPTDLIVAKDADQAQTAEAAPAPKVEAAPKLAAAGPATCRKFIPAVGVTVTVACD